MMFSVVIPAYNEAQNITQTIMELKQVLAPSGFAHDYEIIVVDDHSNDKTYEFVESFKEEKIKCIRLSRRYGSHTAIRAGFAASKGDAVLCIAADGQEDTAVVTEMAEKWNRGAKIVWALRKQRNAEPWYIRRSAQLFYRFLAWLGDTEHVDIDFSRADFFLLDRHVVDAINACAERNTSLFGLIVWLGFTQDFVEYDRAPRRYGKSKWNFISRLRLAKDWIVAFSGVPLKLMSIVGFIIAIIGFVYGIYVVIFALMGRIPPSGWSSIIVAVFVLGGVQMIMLGIVGEYLWRNLDESRKRPLFFIETTTADQDKDNL